MRASATSSKSTEWVRGIVLLGLLLSTTASSYFLMRKSTTEHVMRRFDYVSAGPKHYAEIRPEWRPRIASTALARAIYARDRRVMAEHVATLFAACFFATGLLYVLIDRRAAPLLLLGTFAALYYCNTPRAENTWYPWDMPSLFFGAATLLLALRRAVVPLALTVLMAVTFKETLALMALFFLFYEGFTPRWRMGWAGGVLIAGVVLRLVIEHGVGRPVHHTSFLHLDGNGALDYRAADNLRYLFSGEVNHVLWANAGLWLTVFLIPSRDPVLSGFRWIVLAFYVGLLAAGSFNEFRVFLEVLPGSLLLLHRLFDGDGASRSAHVPIA